MNQSSCLTINKAWSSLGAVSVELAVDFDFDLTIFFCLEYCCKEQYFPQWQVFSKVYSYGSLKAKMTCRQSIFDFLSISQIIREIIVQVLKSSLVYKSLKLSNIANYYSWKSDWVETLGHKFNVKQQIERYRGRYKMNAIKSDITFFLTKCFQYTNDILKIDEKIHKNKSFKRQSTIDSQSLSI